MMAARFLVPVVVTAILLLSACEKEEKASFLSHQFSIRIPEFLEIPPEVSLERFSLMEPKLDSVDMLKHALPKAPETVRPQINRWVEEPHTLNVYQVKQDQVQVFMLGPSSGKRSEDREFQEIMETSITGQVKELVSEVTPTELQPPSQYYNNSRQRASGRSSYSR